MLDVADFTANPAAPELGGLGVCQVRFGKAMRGSPPRRRSVAAVMPWAAGGARAVPDGGAAAVCGGGASGAVVDRTGRADLAAAGR